jgi:hypothetical protein
MNTYKQIPNLKKIRQFTLSTIEGLTEDQFNKIHNGYNNNIIWNVAHMIAAEQGVCYLRAGVKTHISEEFYESYKPGSKPVKHIPLQEIEEIKLLLIKSLEQLETDLQSTLFDGYMPWTTRYGVEMNNIDQALDFLPFHEGMHLGYIMALKRLV